MIRNLGIVVAVLVSGSLAAGQSAKDDHPRSDTPQMANATYSETIGPLIERKCLHCHSPGGLAPMSFMSYAELRDWAKNSYTPLDALVRTRAMPPWSADPEIGNFTNPEYMTDAEIDLLLRWIESGYPKGDGNYQAPAPRSEWTGGKPDHIFELPTYTVAAARTAEYRLAQVVTNFPEDRWIVATEVQPGNRYAVRGIFGGLLGAYQSGQTGSRYPTPYGMLLKKGETVRIRIHYAKEEGVEETDQSRIGVFFAKDDERRHEILQAPMRAEPFTIAAGRADFEVTTRFVFPEDGDIISLMPVMHSRGKRVDYTFRSSDGAEQTLLAIPAWNPNWKYRYILANPLFAPKGSVITATALFDNSEANLKNPDPWSDVSMGPEGETFEGWLGYTLSGPAK